MVAILFMLRAYESKDRKWVYINTVISAIALSLGLVVWNGSAFIIAVYILALVLVLLYAFIKADDKLIFVNTILSIGLLVIYGLQSLYVYAHMANPGLPFGPGPHGLLDLGLFYIPIIIANLAAWYFIKRPLLNKRSSRAIASLCAIIVFAAILLIFFRSELIRIESGATATASPISSNTLASSVPIGQTTQETQPPNYSFLYSSFIYS